MVLRIDNRVNKPDSQVFTAQIVVLSQNTRLGEKEALLTGSCFAYFTLSEVFSNFTQLSSTYSISLNIYKN